MIEQITASGRKSHSTQRTMSSQAFPSDGSRLWIRPRAKAKAATTPVEELRKVSVQRPNACEKRLITFSQSYPCHVVLVEKETAVVKARSGASPLKFSGL